jgi:1-acyl-sn-glycerol-3-phosphate acyltransferase
VDEVKTKRARSNPIPALWKFAGLSALTLTLIGACAVMRLSAGDQSAKDRLSIRWVHRWARWTCAWLRIRVGIDGAPPRDAALLAPNHTTYLDIPALASISPCLFAPKGEIAAWPLIGSLLRWLGMPMITRQRSRSLVDQKQRIANLLDRNAGVCIFLEGTSTANDRVLPFKPALLQAAMEQNVAIMPVGVRWSAANDVVNVGEDIAYWRPEHNILTHSWRLLGLGDLSVRLHFGESIIAGPDDNRKDLARRLRESVSDLSRLPMRVGDS